MKRPFIKRLLGMAALLLVPCGEALADKAEKLALLDSYYDMHRQGETDQAVQALKTLLEFDPKHAEAWRALGYHYQSGEQHRLAAEAFAMAAEGRDDELPDVQMLMAAGYAYQAAGLDDQASRQFSAAKRHARSAERYADACRASIFTAPLMRPRLDPPWRISAYSDTVYLSRDRNTVTENRLRLHRFLSESQRVSAYGQLAYQDDTRSRIRDGVPKIYNDNYTSLGAGVDWRPHPSLRLYTEISRYRDQLERPSQERYSNDLRSGVTAFHSWGKPPQCRQAADWPLRAYGQVYGSLERVERYQNLLGQITLWQGVRLFEWRMTSLSAYGKVNLLWDSKDLFYNNLIEAGPGLSWRPSLAWPLELRLERLIGRYLDEPGSNGYHFSNTRLQMIINFNL